MKIGRFLALGALAYGAYYAYKRREDTCFIVEVLFDVSKNKVLFLDDVKVAFDIVQIVRDIFS